MLRVTTISQVVCNQVQLLNGPMRIVVHSIQCLLIAYRIKQTKMFSVLVLINYDLIPATSFAPPLRCRPAVIRVCSPNRAGILALHPLVAPRRRD